MTILTDIISNEQLDLELSLFIVYMLAFYMNVFLCMDKLLHSAKFCQGKYDGLQTFDGKRLFYVFYHTPVKTVQRFAI